MRVGGEEPAAEEAEVGGLEYHAWKEWQDDLCQ